MTEDELHAEVTALADDLGIWWHHCGDSRYCEGHPGLPDLLLLGDRGLMFAEEKGEDGRRSMAQVLFGRNIAAAPAPRYELWTPEQWRRGLIRGQLRAIA